jgi:prepilin-type N-terminal cleavage/methylation domain-containing protein
MIRPLTCRGFTYLELLIVITLIATLAAIGVPNFLEAQTRAKVARARADMATLMVAVEEYHRDHHAYPPNAPQVDSVLQQWRGGELFLVNGEQPFSPNPMGALFDAALMGNYEKGADPFGAQTAQSPSPPGGAAADPGDIYRCPLIALTTPVPYLPSLGAIQDPFFGRAWAGWYETNLYLTVNWSGLGGGGLRVDPGGGHVPFIAFSSGPNMQIDTLFPTNVNLTLYDPTNGTTSGGDLVEYPR